MIFLVSGTWVELGALLTPQQVASIEGAAEQKYNRLKRSSKLVTVTTEQLRKMLG